jgi:type I restriction enzyme S subunit
VDAEEGDVVKLRSSHALAPSGVDWLGRVPKHWRVQRLKFFLRKFEQGWSPQCDNRTAEPGEWGVLKVGCMNSGTYDEGENKALPAGVDPLPELEVKVGDVLMSRSNTTELVGAVGRVHQTQGRILVCDKLYRLTLDQTCLDPNFAVYLLRSHAARQQIERDASGASNSMKNISNERVANLLFAFSPLPEQRAIAAFLDRKTADIDSVIAAKERMLTLLHKKRQGLINRAATRGFNAAATTKESGTDCLGRVPAHWKVLRVKHMLRRIEQGWSPDSETRLAGPDEWGVLKAGCVNRGEFNEAEHKTLPTTETPIPSLEVRGGDLLVCRASGSPDLVGSAALVEACRPKLLLCDKLFRLHCSPARVLPAFLAAALNAQVARVQIERATNGAEGLPNNITQAAVTNLTFALPPLEEQAQIVNTLAAEKQRYKALVSMIETQIVKLREYRQTLVSASVTGKIEVPEG